MSFLFFFYLILRHTVTSHAGTPARERKKKKWKRGRGFNSNFFRFFPIFFFFFFFISVLDFWKNFQRQNLNHPPKKGSWLQRLTIFVLKPSTWKFRVLFLLLWSFSHLCHEWAIRVTRGCSALDSVWHDNSAQLSSSSVIFCGDRFSLGSCSSLFPPAAMEGHGGLQGGHLTFEVFHRLDGGVGQDWARLKGGGCWGVVWCVKKGFNQYC